jgi:hypothetical protein
VIITNRRILLILIILLIILTGCDSTGVVIIDMAKERKKLALEWLSESPIVCDGSEQVYILKKDGMGKIKVDSPPDGSIFLYYQDIATRSRDAFLGFTSTEAEAEYLKSICEIYQFDQDNDLLERAIRVGNRLKEKVFYFKLKGINKKVALINRLTRYNYNEKRWEESTDEVYTEDIINATNALIQLAKITKSRKYDRTIEDLLETIVTYQDQIKSEQGMELHGGIYYNITNYYQDEYFYPSLDIYPLYFTLDILEAFNAAYDYFNNPEYKILLTDYLTWVEGKIKWSEENIPSTGLNGAGDHIGRYEEKWVKEKQTSEDILKMIYGLSLWKPDNSMNYSRILETIIGAKKMGTWHIPEYVSNKGYPTLKGDLTQNAKLYLALYINVLEKGSQRRSDLLIDIVSKQRINGDGISTGAWQKGNYTDVKITSIIIRSFFRLIN